MPQKQSELLKISVVCLKIFLCKERSYCMIQKISGWLEYFRIAMLPCYLGFSLSAFGNIGPLGTFRIPWTFRYLLNTLDP